ncbi:hypothetical protein Snoj_35800 [Streptomyces nojiriensis]|uniref:Lipoprotein n=1 Tax=Streptomyces nojiriensis TaxID=66374 RepID=A0ABQ3SNX7_9ACTN|nr:hypothetical protein [Streptomyces nojiriensis]QTI43219.1 hypothetical protein JYK04_00981 [Streptomyces nojiriensis]GGS31085.1 hypothetical protein GCM10010205_71620 [Streptomyces nojiriensis]GHI69662.1 hypothetical protein Snoj_35800 [Streptomyces nojiriensis]
MGITSTARRTRAEIAVSIAALAAGSLILTACSGSSDSAGKLDGIYYVKDVNGTSDLGQLVVKGSNVSHHEYSCDGVYEEPDVTSTGEFNKDQSQIIWTVAGDDTRNRRTGTEPISTSSTSISVSGSAYVRDNSDAGKALLDAFKAKCKK